MRRKCVILQNTQASPVPMEIRPNRHRRDNIDRSAQFEAFKALMVKHGVEITTFMPGQKVVFGWVEKEQIPVIAALDEVYSISDDYAYLNNDNTSL